MSAQRRLRTAWLRLTAAKADLAAAEKRAQAELATARDEGQKRIGEAEKRAQLIIDEAKKTASEEAARIIANAKADAEQQVTKAREELRGEVATLAVKGAEQILKREVNAAAHADLLNQLKTKIKVGIRWVASENIHLTLKFLGNTSENLIPKISDGLSAALGDVRSFQFEVGGFGAFPTLKHPRTLWVGIAPNTDLQNSLKYVIKPFTLLDSLWKTGLFHRI